jgi:hypothetical protein
MVLRANNSREPSICCLRLLLLLLSVAIALLAMVATMRSRGLVFSIVADALLVQAEYERVDAIQVWDGCIRVELRRSPFTDAGT